MLFMKKRTTNHLSYETKNDFVKITEMKGHRLESFVEKRFVMADK